MLVLGTRELLRDSVSAWSDLSAPKPGLGTSEQVRTSQPQFLQSVKWGRGYWLPLEGGEMCQCTQGVRGACVFRPRASCGLPLTVEGARGGRGGSPGYPETPPARCRQGAEAFGRFCLGLLGNNASQSNQQMKWQNGDRGGWNLGTGEKNLPIRRPSQTGRLLAPTPVSSPLHRAPAWECDSRREPPPCFPLRFGCMLRACY